MRLFRSSILALGLGASLGLVAPVSATTFVVDSTQALIHAPASPAGSGARCTATPADCTLYDARIEADGSAGLDRIEFNIPMTDSACDAGTGVCRIVADHMVAGGGGNALRFIDGVEIDAGTQPGATVNTLDAVQGGLDMSLKIELGGPPAPTPENGVRHLDLGGGGLIRGLAFTRMPMAIKASPAAGTQLRIEGCIFGARPGSTQMVFASIEADEDRLWNAIEVVETGSTGAGDPLPQVIIGGAAPAQRNWFASHTRAIVLHGKPVALAMHGNLVGTNKDARGRNGLGSAISLSTWSAEVSARTTLDIGGADPMLRNYFGGQFVLEKGATPGNALVRGNSFGIDPEGVVLANSSSFLQLGSGYRIGGTGAGEGNDFIHRNGAYAIRKNLGSGGAFALPSGRSSALGNSYVGVIEPGYNGDFGYGGAPIYTDLRSGGGAINDAGDLDVGPFGLTLQNWPVITAYSVSAAGIELTYHVDSTVTAAAYDLTVEFYLHTVAPSLSYQFVGRDVYSAAAAMQARSITLPLPPDLVLPADPVFVATATSSDALGLSGETSEFSFHDIALAWDAGVPAVFPLNQTREVRVNLTSTSPFKPHGVLRIERTDGFQPVLICEGPVQATTTASRSSLGCNFTPTQAGALQLRAYWAASGTTFFDLGSASSGPGSVAILRDASIAVVTDALFMDGFEQTP
jgi:hypothetical protein